MNVLFKIRRLNITHQGKAPTKNELNPINIYQLYRSEYYPRFSNVGSIFMKQLPKNVYHDIMDEGFVLTDLNGYQRFRAVDGDAFNYLFKVDINAPNVSGGYKTIIRYVDLKEYRDDAINMFAELSGINLDMAKQANYLWQPRVAASIFSTSIATYLNLRSDLSTGDKNTILA